YRVYGHRFWWPARTPFEMVVGAVLTQNVRWERVEQSLRLLERVGYLSPDALARANPKDLVPLLRPVGYYSRKAPLLVRIAQWYLAHHRRSPDLTWREGLLEIHGVGPETADSILLYAFRLPRFVVDAYTRRILGRVYGRPGPWDARYETFQAWIEARLPRDVPLYQDFHAQLVEVGKQACRKRTPRCERCPLRKVCAYALRDGREAS
ncbi:MAG: hypothetical protein L3J76_05835, partial [Candidatus Hydrothermae bacterium]|nr:hypothetical protein [Candidatus Hydrothermae bacterium]